MKTIKTNKLKRALGPSSFKSQDQIETDLVYLGSLKERKVSERLPKSDAEKMLDAQKARRARLAKKGGESMKPFQVKVEVEIKVIENPNALYKFAGFRLGKKNARKILIGCEVTGGIDRKGRVVEGVTNSCVYYNDVVYSGGDGILDHSSMSESLAYLDPATLFELQELANRLGVDFDKIA